MNPYDTFYFAVIVIGTKEKENELEENENHYLYYVVYLKLTKKIIIIINTLFICLLNVRIVTEIF